jgi:copper transport protein
LNETAVAVADAVPALLTAVLYAGIAVMVGALGIYWFVLPRCGLVTTERAPVQRHAATAALAAAAVVLLAVPARVALQLRDFLEPGEAWRPALNAILFTTTSGKAAQLAMVWTTAALLAFSVARAGRLRGWRAATLAVLVVAMTPGLGGHPAAADFPVLAMTAATIHVLAAGLWLGTLFHLWRTMQRSSVATAERMVAAFHRLAQVAVVLLVASGAYHVLTMVEAPADLVRTAWGRLLLAKLALAAVALGLGAMHLRTAGFRYARGAHGSVRRTVGIELAVAATILGVTGFLAGTPPP